MGDENRSCVLRSCVLGSCVLCLDFIETFQSAVAANLHASKRRRFFFRQRQSARKKRTKTIDARQLHQVQSQLADNLSRDVDASSRSVAASGLRSNQISR